MPRTPTSVWVWRRLATVLALCSCTLGAVPAVAQERSADVHWVATWTTSQVALKPPETPESAPVSPLQAVRVDDQTLRQTVRVSIGGAQIRVAFANTFGTEPVTVGAGYVALKDPAGSEPRILAPGVPLTFGGEASATIEIGSTLVSDPVGLQVPPLADLVVDLYLPGDTWATRSPATGHGFAWATNYLSQTGDHTGLAEFQAADTMASWMFLARVDVLAPEAVGAVVAFGDSITEGFGVDTGREPPVAGPAGAAAGRGVRRASTGRGECRNLGEPCVATQRTGGVWGRPGGHNRPGWRIRAQCLVTVRP